MQILVRLIPHLPESLSVAERDALFSAERKRGLELQAEGKVVRMWRVLGTPTGISLWDVDSLEEFQASLSSLPAWKYCNVEVTPLIQHPLEAAFQKGEQA